MIRDKRYKRKSKHVRDAILGINLLKWPIPETASKFQDRSGVMLLMLKTH